MDKIEHLDIPIDEKAILSKLIDALTEMEAVSAVFLVGSIVKGLYKKTKSGIDLIVLIKDNYSDYKIIERLRKSKFDFFLSDDIFILRGTLISLFIQNYDSYLEYLNSIITSDAMEIVLKDWTIGGVCKEVILHDIANALFFYDVNGKITELSHKLKNEYVLSDAYGKSLVVQLKRKLQLTMMQYDEFNMILFQIGFWECIELVERLYCHEMKVYNPGFKHILAQGDFGNRVSMEEACFNNIYTIKMKNILEKINAEYTEVKKW